MPCEEPSCLCGATPILKMGKWRCRAWNMFDLKEKSCEIQNFSCSVCASATTVSQCKSLHPQCSLAPTHGCRVATFTFLLTSQEGKLLPQLPGPQVCEEGYVDSARGLLLGSAVLFPGDWHAYQPRACLPGCWTRASCGPAAPRAHPPARSLPSSASCHLQSLSFHFWRRCRRKRS